MKEVLVTIKATINEDVYEDFKSEGYSDEVILKTIKGEINGARTFGKLVSDFEVESVEVKG